MPKYYDSAVNNIWDTSNSMENVHFSTLSMGPVTLTFMQGHDGRYAFKGNGTNYLLGKYHDSAVNNIQDISNLMENVNFSTFSMDPVTLTFDQGHYNRYDFEGIVT